MHWNVPIGTKAVDKGEEWSMRIVNDWKRIERSMNKNIGKGHKFFHFEIESFEHGKELYQELYRSLVKVEPDMTKVDDESINHHEPLYLVIHVRHHFEYV